MKAGLLTYSGANWLRQSEWSGGLEQIKKDLQEYGDTLKKMLHDLGFSVFREESLILTDAESLDACRKLSAFDWDIVVMIVGTWADPGMIVTTIQKLNIPVVLCGYRQWGSNSLVASGATKGALAEMGIPFRFLYGRPDDMAFRCDFIKTVRSSAVKPFLKTRHIGLVGSRAGTMYTCLPDLNKIKKDFGIEIKSIDNLKVMIMADNFSDKIINQEVNRLKKEFGQVEVGEALIGKSIRVYKALKEIVEEFSLTSLTIYGQTPGISEAGYACFCLPVAMLNEEGVVVACEGDVNAVITMEIMKFLSGSPAGFSDIRFANIEDNALDLCNCGAIPLNFAKCHKDVGLTYNTSEKGINLSFVARPGIMTIARLYHEDGRYKMQIFRGKALDKEQSYFADCGKYISRMQTWPRAYIQVAGDIRRIVQGLRSNHLHFCYGDIVKELKISCDVLGIKPVVYV